MKKLEWAYRKADGKAKGTQGWEVDKEKCSSFTYTGLWRDKKCVALLVGEGFDEGSDTVAETGDFLVKAANHYPALLEYFNASVGFNNAHGEGPDGETLEQAVVRATVAENRLDAATRAVHQLLSSS